MPNVGVTGSAPAQSLRAPGGDGKSVEQANAAAEALGAGWNQPEPGRVQQRRRGGPGLAAGPQNPQAQAIIKGSANKSFPSVYGWRRRICVSPIWLVLDSRWFAALFEW